MRGLQCGSHLRRRMSLTMISSPMFQLAMPLVGGEALAAKLVVRVCLAKRRNVRQQPMGCNICSLISFRFALTMHWVCMCASRWRPSM